MPKPSRSPRPNKRSGKADDIVTYRPGVKGRTDWERVKNVTDEEIDAQIRSNPDAAPDLPDEWLAQADIVIPEKKTAISLRVDDDVLKFFKATGRGYQTRMNAVLKSYVRANRIKGGKARGGSRT